MKQLFFLFFALPLFASAQQTSDENKIGKLELLSSIHDPDFSFSTFRITNKKHETFTVWLNGGNADIEFIELGPNEVKEVTVYGYNWGTAYANFQKKNEKFAGDQLEVEVPNIYY